MGDRFKPESVIGMSQNMQLDQTWRPSELDLVK